MPIARIDETDLLIPLYDGVHGEPQPWALFRKRLTRRVRSDEVTLIASTTANPVADDWLAGLRGGRVYPVEEGIDPGAGFGRVVRADADGVSLWLVIRRRSSDFSAADGALLGALAPHLAVALRTRVALERQRVRASVENVALSQAAVEWVALGRDARVLALSDGAAGLLGRGVDERLAAGRSEAGATIAAFCLAPSWATAVVIGDAEPVGLLLVPPPVAVATDVVPAVAAVGLLMMPGGGDLAARAAVLSALHGLAPSEARFAAAIGSGESIVGAAARLGLTIETARNYSKRVYAKLRVEGQVELVRLVEDSVAALV
ncbi:helix-turn-helix transcriptional regulator [Sphingomonas radiodurans]|uniref:helix-turn-helix transcriptional regulator n=1 Tax=Sphingomonas radiodurans TaxID=2890321 RepID=UPI001E4DA542|nr:hypothetical protein [Sphingomonas radiodurans]WBH18099.1 hypothetical protein LLW23_08410 [Sphingomonas radiodurans]